jgi:hypothetical protein
MIGLSGVELEEGIAGRDHRWHEGGAFQRQQSP